MSAARIALSLTALLWPLNAATAAVVITALPAPVNLHDDFFGSYEAIDVNADGATDFTFGYDFAFVGLRTELSNRAVITLHSPPDIGGPPRSLSPGYILGLNLAPIGSESPLWASSDFLGGFVSPGENAFAGIVLVLSTGSSSSFNGRGLIGIEFASALGTHYGYLDIDAGAGYAGMTLYGWAYETQPGVPIQTAFVPEPSTAAYLGVGTALILKRNGQTRKQNKALQRTARGLLVSTLGLIRRCLGFDGAQPRP